MMRANLMRAAHLTRSLPRAHPRSPLLLRRFAHAEVPPLGVRAGLVGGAVALATPLFPIIGLNQLAFRWLTLDQRLVLTGGTSMLYFSSMVAAPQFFYYAPLLLPFAAGNGAVASATYVATEIAAGGPRALASWDMLGVPVAGPAIGVATALAAPLAYPVAFALMWPSGGASALGGGAATLWTVAFDPAVYEQIRQLCYNPVMFPCLATTGALSGWLIHLGLRPLIVGVPGVGWPRLAGAVLAAVLAGLAALYSTAGRVEIAHLRDAHPAPPPSASSWLRTATWLRGLPPCYVDGEAELCWVAGLDATTGELVSRRLRPARPANADADDDADGRRCAFDATERTERGCARADDAAALRAKLADGEVAVYASRRAAFFDGLPAVASPLDRGAVGRALEGLPLGEHVLTDAVALLVAGAVDGAVVERGVTACLPLLRDCSLAERLRSNTAFTLHRSWADGGADATSALLALLADLRLRRAQLAELIRLDEGTPAGPYTRPHLEAHLGGAGIDVPRARALLAGGQRPSQRQRGPPGGALASNREDDWRTMGAAGRRERRETAGGAALVLVVGGACVGLLAAAAGGGLG